MTLGFIDIDGLSIKGHMVILMIPPAAMITMLKLSVSAISVISDINS